jgi:predicted MFS family arabinose efflux permease
MSEAFGWRAAFFGAGMLATGVAVMAARWLPHDIKHPDGGFWPASLTAVYAPLLLDRGMRRLYGASALRAICWIGLLTYFGAYLSDEMGLSVGKIGIVYMLAGGAYLLGSLLSGGPLSRVPTRPLISLASLIMAAALGLSFLQFTGTAGAIGFLALAAFSGAIGWVGIATLLTAETPAGTGVTMTLNGALFNLGAAGGGAIGGLLLALGGYSAMAICLPLFAVAGAVLVWRR